MPNVAVCRFHLSTVQKIIYRRLGVCLLIVVIELLPIAGCCVAINQKFGFLCETQSRKTFDELSICC